MINIAMTIREMVALASSPTCTGDLYEKIVKALEDATRNSMAMVACNGVVYNGQYWDNKISAIRYLRLATNMGLKDAKDWIENCMQNDMTYYTKPLPYDKAVQLHRELSEIGCSCWIAD